MARASAALATALLLVACGEPAATTQSAPRTNLSWQRLADPPLVPRFGAVTAWTGKEVLVTGGDPGAPCPLDADCQQANPEARDGAALDPVTGTWRPIAELPANAGVQSASAVVDDCWYVLGGTALLRYDIDRDQWHTIARPAGLDWASMVADGQRLVFASGSDELGEHPDRVYDVRTGRWSALPDDPIGPAYDRSITATPAGLVLTAKELVPNPGAEKPSLLEAAVLDRETDRWKALPTSDQLGGGAWTWTGSRMVDASLGGADGGEVGNWGRTVPNGGALDPATGTWSHLPDAPDEQGGAWPVFALDGARIATAGYLYDDAAGTWTRLPRPDDAPDQPGNAVWAGSRLVVIGGAERSSNDAADALSPHAWMLTVGR